MNDDVQAAKTILHHLLILLEGKRKGSFSEAYKVTSKGWFVNTFQIIVQT